MPRFARLGACPLLLDLFVLVYRPVHLSSNFCRLAAIGMGWDKAFGNVNNMGEIDQANKRWVDVDLKGTEIPVWQAFELF